MDFIQTMDKVQKHNSINTNTLSESYKSYCGRRLMKGERSRMWPFYIHLWLLKIIDSVLHVPKKVETSLKGFHLETPEDTPTLW